MILSSFGTLSSTRTCRSVHLSNVAISKPYWNVECRSTRNRISSPRLSLRVTAGQWSPPIIPMSIDVLLYLLNMFVHSREKMSFLVCVCRSPVPCISRSTFSTTLNVHLSSILSLLYILRRRSLQPVEDRP